MLEHPVKLVIAAIVLILAIVCMVVIARGPKSIGTAMLMILMQFFSPIPPPQQTMQDARDAEGTDRKKSTDSQGKDRGAD